MDVNKIRELLPHRYPRQLVDKVIALGANTIVGIKNVTSNEPFFQGHFPEEPVMPGVLQIEAMAQVDSVIVAVSFGSCLLLNKEGLCGWPCADMEDYPA